MHLLLNVTSSSIGLRKCCWWYFELEFGQNVFLLSGTVPSICYQTGNRDSL